MSGRTEANSKAFELLVAKGGIEPPTQAFQVARDFSIYTLAGLGDHGPRGQEATIEAFQQISELGVEAVTPIDYPA